MLGKRFFCEKLIVEKMMIIYCKGHHQSSKGLCAECQSLLEYAHKRIECCFFGAQKPVCGNCPIHCYQKEMKERIAGVMRYAGPRMLYKHPGMAIYHAVRSLRKPPVIKKK